MSILKLRDENGAVVEIAALRGEKGEPGEVTTAAANAAFANALKGRRSGEITAADDVSPAEHELSVTVKSKNLLDIHSAQPISGETITIEDNTVILKDFSTNRYGIRWENVPLVVGETYTLSVSDISAHGSAWGWRIAYKDGTMGTLTNWTQTVTILKEVNQVYFYAAFGDMTETQDIRIEKPMIERGTSVTDYTPYIGDLTSVTVSRWGKNVVPCGTLTFTRSRDVRLDTPLPAGTYTISACITSSDTDGDTSAVSLNYVNGGTAKTVAYLTLSRGTRDSRTVTLKEPVTNLYFCAAYNETQGTGDTATWADIQLEVGSSATDFESYSVAAVSPAADGKVEGLTSVYPTTTLMTDTSGAVAQWEYNRDTNKVMERLVKAIISLGGTV